MVPLKYFSNFLRTFQMLLTNCRIKFFLTWCAECIIITGNVDHQEPKYAITDTKRQL